jgi:translation initiation factor 2B subunit (eIF-2B alpha/beta/delta family)
MLGLILELIKMKRTIRTQQQVISNLHAIMNIELENHQYFENRHIQDDFKIYGRLSVYNRIFELTPPGYMCILDNNGICWYECKSPV